MADEKFKLPHASYDELVKIIRAYGHQSEPASLDTLSKLIGVNPTIISRNAGFLVAVSIIEGGSRKIPTSEGKELAHALDHDIPEEVQSSWKRIVLANDFLSKVLTAIKIRNGMESAVLEAHIAYSAGQPKKPEFMTGARTIIEIFRKAQLVKEQDGKIIPDTESVSINIDSFATPPSYIAKQTPPQPVIPDKTANGFQINIRININCSIDDLDSLASKLKDFSSQINMQSDKTELNA